MRDFFYLETVPGCCIIYYSITAYANKKAPLPNEFVPSKISALSPYVKEKLSLSDKRDRKIADERIF